MTPQLSDTDAYDCDVIVVDDDELTLELLARVLRKSGCEARYFHDSGKAIEYLRTHHTKVLLVDHRMPTMSGLEVLQRVSQRYTNSADNTYLCSASELAPSVVSAAEDLGAQVMLKDVYRNQADFLNLLAR